MPVRKGRFAQLKVPLRAVLLIPSILFYLALTGLVGYVLIRHSQRATGDLAHRICREVSAHVTDHFDAVLGVPHRINAYSARMIARRWVDPDDPQDLKRHFWEQVQLLETSGNILFVNDEGGLIGVGRDAETGSATMLLTTDFGPGPLTQYALDARGGRSEVLLTQPDFDPRLQSWYARAVEAGQASWIPPHLSLTGQETAIAVSRPVFDEHQRLLGVCAIELSVSDLSDFLQGLDLGDGQSFIFDRSGLLVASSADETPWIGEGVRGTERRLHILESASPTIRQVAAILTGQIEDYQTLTQSRHDEVRFDGTRHYLHVFPYENRYGVDWLVAIALPRVEVLDQVIADVAVTGALVAASFALITVLGVLLTHRVAAPVTRLTDAVRAVGEGTWKRVEDRSRIRELDALTQNYNAMVAHLQATMGRLHTEIAERKRAEASLRASEQRYRSLFEQSNDAVFIVDLEGNQLDVNQRAVDMLGYSREALIGMNFQHLVVEEEQDDSVDKLAVLREFQSLPPYQRTIRRRDGSTFPVEVNAELVRDASGSPSHIQSVVRDVTQRVEMVEALQRSEEAFRSFVEQSIDGIALADETGHLIEWNGAMAQITGVTRGDVMGRMLWDVLLKTAAEAHRGPERREQLKLTVRKVLTGGLEGARGRVMERQLIRPDGTRRDVLMSVFPIATAEGFMVGSILRDITARREMEDRLREQDRLAAIAQLAAGIAHDFRNLLSTIILYTEMDMGLQDLPPRIARHLRIVSHESHRASDLVQQILDFSSNAMLNLRPLDLVDFIEQRVLTLETLLPDDVDLRLALDPGSCTVNADSERLEQALHNLVDNARDAMPEGGTLQVGLSTHTVMPGSKPPVPEMPAGDWACLTVSDTGIGMTGEVRKHLFEPFFTTKEVGQGRGLGLPQVYGIVRQHEGYVGVETALGEGTAFRIYLPTYREARKEEREDEAAGQPRERIVLITPDDSLRRAAKRAVASMGYRVITARRGREALALCRRPRWLRSQPQPVVLAIVDLALPEMESRNLLQALLTSNPKLRALALVGPERLDSDLEALRAMGFDDVVFKPLEVNGLKQIVTQMLEP